MSKIFKPRNIKQFKTKALPEGRECTACGEFKVWAEYNVAKKSHSGRTSKCKVCIRAHRPARDIKKEVIDHKKRKLALKKAQPYLVKARAIRSSLLNRARRFPELRDSTPAIVDIHQWLLAQPLTCYYSGEKVTLWDMHIDHKIPPIRGGTNELSNLCIASVKMNSSKGQMTEKEFKSLLELVQTWEDKGNRILIRLRQGFM
jgi:5-methylcytosine-specific restriction endonuclease McrA